MKKHMLLLIFGIVTLTACSHLLEGDPLSIEVGDYKQISDTVKITPDIGLNDSHSMGLEIGCPASESAENKKIEIIDSLPVHFDLSKDMPPVKSQGSVGSCASFATTYYMKSYQEKIQHKYIYDNYGKVMSPSYVYNQVKVAEDCGSGSCLLNNLNLLKKQGATTWQQFPYDGKTCSIKPSNKQKELAEKNKIKAFYTVSSSDSTNINYTKTNAIKSLLYKKIPVVIAMTIDKDFATADKKSDSVYIYNSYNITKPYGRHALLIVGYDDRLNAFKVINSWGTNWANKGYSYLSYDFFDKTNENYQYVLETYYSEDL